MNFTSNKRSRWFTAADALIIFIALALIAGTAFLFLVPNMEETAYETVDLTLQVNFGEEYAGEISTVKENEPLYHGDKLIGSIIRKTPDNCTVYAKITANYKDGVYLLDDTPLRINGAFKLETTYDVFTGNLSSIQREG
ncbi:MAG: hypothetical protein IJN86_07030 [Clostridia bacterium]|nr:hypothetical protein [Clostridia bacterium]MBQ7048686.1 hypothetical protein [Clostridia bacterium]